MTQRMNQSQQSGVGPRKQSDKLSVRGGFSLIDLMVSLAVIVTLLIILLPSLSRAQEAARRVGCASNIRQVGMALQMYAYDYGDRLPRSVFLEEGRTYSPHDTIFIYLSGDSEFGRQQVSHPRWDGLGTLFHLEYLDGSNAFYCPSHAGEHSYDIYKERFDRQDRDIAMNYQYRLPKGVRYFTDFHSSTTLLADAMRTQADYNHVVGNYMFKADLSITWFNDSDGRLFRSLSGDLSSPNEASDAIQMAWDLLDNRGSSAPNGGGGHADPGGPIAGGRKN
jgi:competence protein ComGC